MFDLFFSYWSCDQLQLNNVGTQFLSDPVLLVQCCYNLPWNQNTSKWSTSVMRFSSGFSVQCLPYRWHLLYVLYIQHLGCSTSMVTLTTRHRLSFLVTATIYIIHLIRPLYLILRKCDTYSYRLQLKEPTVFFFYDFHLILSSITFYYSLRTSLL